MARSHRRLYRWSIALTLALGLAGSSPLAAASFTTFDSGLVRPLALSADQTRLFAVNTPDNQLEIFSVGTDSKLTHSAAVTVGLEPVALALRSASEVWVVNHLSDSVSIVDVGSSPPRVTRTLLVGDEPRDIVFAGPGGNRAFITCAHRGQNSGVPFTDFTAPGRCLAGANAGQSCTQDSECPTSTCRHIGRADVWVFDATNLGASLGGTPLTTVSLFGDTPRALAVSPDG